MSNDGAEAPQRKTNTALIVSLCLNFLLVGVIAAALFHAMMMHPFLLMRGHPPMSQHPPFLAPRLFMEAAPAEAGKIHEIMKAHRAKLQELRRASSDARRDAMHVFEASNFDAQAFDHSLDKVHAADTTLEAEALRIVSESAAALTPEERRAVMAQHPPQHEMGWRRRGRQED